MLLSALKTLFKPRPLDSEAYPQTHHRDYDNPDMEALFGDLPRMINPAGEDDTDRIRQRVVKAYPEGPHLPDQTINRRKLYMAIYDLRTKSKRGWIADDHVRRINSARDGILAS